MYGNGLTTVTKRGVNLAGVSPAGSGIPQKTLFCTVFWLLTPISADNQTKSPVGSHWDMYDTPQVTHYWSIRCNVVSRNFPTSHYGTCAAMGELPTKGLTWPGSGNPLLCTVDWHQSRPARQPDQVCTTISLIRTPKWGHHITISAKGDSWHRYSLMCGSLPKVRCGAR